MVLVLPLLLLMAAGLFQFTYLFLSAIRFEDACGQTAREWAAGTRSTDTLPGGIWGRLGSSQGAFVKGSLRIDPFENEAYSLAQAAKRKEVAVQTGPVGALLEKAKGILFDYSAGRWIVTIRFKSRPFFGLLFPEGIPFRTRLAVIRHPGGTP